MVEPDLTPRGSRVRARACVLAWAVTLSLFAAALFLPPVWRLVDPAFTTAAEAQRFPGPGLGLAPWAYRSGRTVLLFAATFGGAAAYVALGPRRQRVEMEVALAAFAGALPGVGATMLVFELDHATPRGSPVHLLPRTLAHPYLAFGASFGLLVAVAVALTRAALAPTAVDGEAQDAAE